LEAAVLALAPSYLASTVYFYPSLKKAQEGGASGGSGFLLGIPSLGNDKHFVYAATNRHVIDG
jgi:hypothetical protein